MTPLRAFLCSILLGTATCGYGADPLVGQNTYTIKDPKALLKTEIERLNTLIQLTKQSLEGQMKLKELIVEYQKTQDEYLKHPDDNDLLFQLVKSAYRTLQSIKDNHLIQTFDPEFINELQVISQPARKRGIPKS